MRSIRTAGIKTNLHRPALAEALDLDTTNQLQLLKRVFNAKALGKQVIVVRSPSMKGYHIYCDPPLTLHEAIMLGDCKGRLQYWEYQKYSFTFNARLNWYGKIIGWEQPENPLSLPFSSQLIKRRLRRKWKEKPKLKKPLKSL